MRCDTLLNEVCVYKVIGLAIINVVFLLIHLQPYSRYFAEIASKHHCQSINQLRYSTTAATRPYSSTKERTAINGKIPEHTDGTRKIVETKSGKLKFMTCVQSVSCK
jgi:hypothetical protein